MIFVISPRQLSKAVTILDKMHEPWYQIGEVIRGSRRQI